MGLGRETKRVHSQPRVVAERSGVIARTRLSRRLKSRGGWRSEDEGSWRGRRRRGDRAAAAPRVRLLHHRPRLRARHPRPGGPPLPPDSSARVPARDSVSFTDPSILCPLVQVVRHLVAAGHDVHVVTAAPEFVFTTEIASPSLHIRKVLLDCGAVQADALTVDRLASLEKVFLFCF